MLLKFRSSSWGFTLEMLLMLPFTGSVLQEEVSVPWLCHRATLKGLGNDRGTRTLNTVSSPTLGFRHL